LSSSDGRREAAPRIVEEREWFGDRGAYQVEDQEAEFDVETTEPSTSVE
jgi:hypothetical protein